MIAYLEYFVALLLNFWEYLTYPLQFDFILAQKWEHRVTLFC